MSGLDRAMGLAIAAATVGAIVWTSSAPMIVHGSDQGMLRVAWSVRPERIEVCREQSAEALAKLPQHMRQPLVCEGTSARYRLTVRRGGDLVVDRVLHGGGLRQDRRLYVFEELPLERGEVSFEVQLNRIDDPRAIPGSRIGQPASAETVPPDLSLQRRVSVGARQVFLVTYSADRRALVVVEPGSLP
jgi:hypothetical protein